MSMIEQQIAAAKEAAAGHDGKVAHLRAELRGLEAELRVVLTGGSVETSNALGEKPASREDIETAIRSIEQEIADEQRRARVCRDGIQQLEAQLGVEATAKRKRDAHEAGERMVAAAEERYALLAQLDDHFAAIGQLLAKYDHLGNGIRADFEQLSRVAHETHPNGVRQHTDLMQREPAPHVLGSALCAALIDATLNDRAHGMVDVARPIEHLSLADFGAARADELARTVARLRSQIAD